MVSFEKFTLPNGMRIIVHEDPHTPMAVVNILYNVGARDEQEDKTGFAHLFEHLMFGGSENAPRFDEPLQRAGGESNAFTNNDITNYYDLLPAHNIETAFWLESDRMRALNISPVSLEVQRKVVCEEFKEHYLNQPYGDVWHRLSSLAYKVHPYKWPTIGKELSHIENAQLDDVRDFFRRFYHPSNAIMVVAGNVRVPEVRALAEKWFGKIEDTGMPGRHYPREPKQQDPRLMEVRADVPVNALFKAWHTGRRDSRNFYVMDVASDILAEGTSSRLYQNLVRKNKIFSEVDAYVTGSLDEGLFVFEGRLNEGVAMQEADRAVIEELHALQAEEISDYELQKVKNKIESTHAFAEVSLLTRAMHLAYFELLGDAGRINTEMARYADVSAADVMREAQQVFVPDNSATLYYFAENKN